MIVTEDEARTKVCHRSLDSDGTGAACHGSECMAWVWALPVWMADDGSMYGQPIKGKSLTEITRGYCGLVYNLETN